MNKLVGKIIESFLIEAESKHVTVTKGKFNDGQEYQTVSVELIPYIEDRKLVVGYLKANGLDAFKRGTKEPRRIKEALESRPAKELWDIIQGEGIKAGFNPMFE